MNLLIRILSGILLTFTSVTTMSSGKIYVLPGSDVVLDLHVPKHLDNYSPPELTEKEVRIINEICSEFMVDERLICALIKQESQFDREAVSERGALGLMQLMPVTNSEINEKLHIGDASLLTSHIKAGTYYFSTLCGLFQRCTPEDRVRLALAAYNAGPARVYDAQQVAAYLNENPNSWESVRHALPLLSKRYYSLHQLVWEDGRPRNGFFGSSRQTITFVENVMKYYREFSKNS